MCSKYACGCQKELENLFSTIENSTSRDYIQVVWEAHTVQQNCVCPTCCRLYIYTTHIVGIHGTSFPVQIKGFFFLGNGTSSTFIQETFGVKAKESSSSDFTPRKMNVPGSDIIWGFQPSRISLHPSSLDMVSS